MFNLQDFVGSCERFAGAPDGAEQVLELMRSAVRDPDAIKRAVPPNDPGRDILDAPLHRSATCLVFNVTLDPLIVSPPHDHRMWAVIGIYEGQENNTFYRRSGNKVDVVNRRDIRAGGAILLGPDVIHSIANPLGSRTLGLHVYGGDLLAAKRKMWDPHSGEELPYDGPKFFDWCRELAGTAT
jgi:predicted metal-dependent enzyme (double-stranded beta helix superfamily)